MPTTKYKTKNYECLDDIIDYEYEKDDFIRLENKRKRYNIKNFLKKQINIVEENREKNKVSYTDADLITNNVHLMYEMCKHWFIKYMWASNQLPKLTSKIRDLEKENEKLHSRLSKALLQIEILSEKSDMELPEEDNEISAVDKILGMRYSIPTDEEDN